MKKNEKGISLLTLTITIIVLLIIIGVSVAVGKESIQLAKLQSLKTNMLLIKAKARESVEEASFKIGTNTEDANAVNDIRQEVYTTNAKLGSKLSSSEIPEQFNITNSEECPCYFLTPEAKKNWSLERIITDEEDQYLIQFNEEDETVEIYNTIGYDGKYKLSEIEKIEE